MEGHLLEEAELDYEKTVLQARLHEVKSDIDELQIQLQLKHHEAETRSRPDPTNLETKSAAAKQELPSVLPLRVDDPLPQLQFFTALRFESNSSQLLHTDGNMLRRHHIKGIASGVLTFHIQMDVEQETLSVYALRCNTSLWSQKGLSTFLGEASIQGDIHTALYGISSYSALALERANTFAKVQRRLKNNTENKEVSLEEQLCWLGKPNITLYPSTGMELVLSWDIVMSTVGDAESHVAAATKVTDAWRHADEGKHLNKLSQMFHKLVSQMGVEQAAILIYQIFS